MDVIEEFAGTSIHFEPNPRAPRLRAFRPKAAQVAVGHERATIFVHDSDQIDAQGIAHELLHIQRYWVEGVPQLQPLKTNDPSRNGYVETLENEIEHVAIIPRERRLGLTEASYKYWNEVAAERWGDYPWSQLSDKASRRDYALFGRLQLENVSDTTIRTKALEILEKEGVAREAERFASKMIGLATDKPRSASCVARFLEIPHNQLRLIYFEIRNRKWRAAPLPAN